jgi:hypothetical protein
MEPVDVQVGHRVQLIDQLHLQPVPRPQSQRRPGQAPTVAVSSDLPARYGQRTLGRLQTYPQEAVRAAQGLRLGELGAGLGIQQRPARPRQPGAARSDAGQAESAPLEGQASADRQH